MADPGGGVGARAMYGAGDSGISPKGEELGLHDGEDADGSDGQERASKGGKGADTVFLPGGGDSAPGEKTRSFADVEARLRRGVDAYDAVSAGRRIRERSGTGSIRKVDSGEKAKAKKTKEKALNQIWISST